MSWETVRIKRSLVALGTALTLLFAAGTADAKVARDACEGDSGLDLRRVEATLNRPGGVKTWTYVIETCKPFSPTDLRGVDGGEHYAMSLHFDTTGDDGRFERTMDIYNCNASTDQVCADMWAGHGGDRYYGGPRKVGDADATQSSPTSVTVTFPNRWLGKKARNRTGFLWSSRTANETQPGQITFDYCPDGRSPREHP